MNTVKELQADLRHTRNAINTVRAKLLWIRKKKRKLKEKLMTAQRELRVLREFNYQTELELCRSTPTPLALTKLKGLARSGPFCSSHVPRRWRLLIDLKWGTLSEGAFGASLTLSTRGRAAVKMYLK